MIFRGSIKVEADIHHVWAVLNDESKMPLWHPLGATLSYPDGSRRDDPVGQSFEVIYGYGIPPLRQHAEYVDYAYPTLLSVRAFDDAGTVLVRYELTRLGQSTELALHMRPEDYSLSWWILSYLLYPASWIMNKRTLRRLKLLAEA